MLEAEARERQLATLKQNTPLGKKLTNGVSEAPEPRQADDSPLPKKLGNGAHEDTGRRISDDSPLLKKLSNGANERAAAAHAAEYAHTNRTYDCGVPQGRQVKREKSAGPSGGIGVVRSREARYFSARLSFS